MIQSTTYLTLAACVVSVSVAEARHLGSGPQDEPRPTAPAAPPFLVAPLSRPSSAYSYAGASYGSGPCAGDGYDGSGGAGGYGRGGRAGGDESASGVDSSRGGAARAVEVILKASGVPNQNGKVDWPPGLRVLGADAQLQQLEAQLQLAAEQVTAGGANPQLLDEIRLNVEALGQRLLAYRPRRFAMPLAAYEDAERFVQKLQRVPQILAASAPAGRP